MELPPAPTAKGMRHGAADTICIGVPAELAVHNTGHDFTSLTALFEYLNSRIPLCVPGALLLFGWPGIPYGQTGDGSKFPTLQTLVNGGISMVRLEAYIDALFAFHDATPPMLLTDGPLRPLMHATLATMVMHYEIRFKNHESEWVLHRMRETYDEVMSTPGYDAHRTLIEWGDALKRQFEIQNAHLTDRTSHGASEQTVAQIKGLGASMGRMGAQVSDLAQRTVSLERQNQQLLQQNEQLLQQNQQLLQLLQQLQLGAGGVPAAPPPPVPPTVPTAPPTAPAITPAITRSLL